VETSQDSHTHGCGTLVDVRGDRWRVVETVKHDGCSTCRLAGASASNIGIRQTLLLPFDRPRPVVSRTRARRVGRRRWMAGLRAAVASACRHDSLRGAAGAALDLLDYQLEPAIACSRGATRLLLADEVGLGKTIQAGLILADLRARDESARAFVLCPAGLGAQWLEELAVRFRIEGRFVDRPAMRRLQGSAADVGPWEQLAVTVASIDFAKRPEVLRSMEAVRWDLLIVDEAHLCAVAPERAAAVNWVARRARRVVLMTATPHPGEPGAFEALCRIGRLPGEGPALMFRRTRAELGLASKRRCRMLAVSSSAPERRLHALLERYTSLVWDTAPGGGAAADARLAMIVLRKRSASCAASLLASLARRLRWLANAVDAGQPQLPLPFDDGDEPDPSDEEPELALAAPGLADIEAERRMLQRLIDLAGAAVSRDSKPRVLVRLLGRVREPAIVFTEYRDTLTHLAEVFREDRTVATIHGGMDRAARAEAVGAFNRGEASLLLATDAAAHGLNLQSRCRLVVSLELPWNPVRLEQRIGRVDRIGQRRTVHAIHLVARHTAEEKVLARLAARIERARKELGSAGDPLGLPSESEVTGAVFARRPVEFLPPPAAQRGPDSTVLPSDGAGASDLIAPCRIEAAAHDEADRLRQVRAFLCRQRRSLDVVSADLAGSGPWLSVLRLRNAAQAQGGADGFAECGALMAVYETEIVDGRGLSLERLLTLVRWKGSDQARPDPGAAAAALQPGSPLRAAMEREAARLAAERLVELQVAVPARLEALKARHLAMAATDEGPPIVACQPGLFDRRALRRADDDREGRLRRSAEAEARLKAIVQAARVSLAGPPRLLLVAVLDTRTWPRAERQEPRAI
jgi:superfamily II DNA or RNA helicase